MRKELLTLAVACLLCVPAFAADDEEPKGVSDIKEVGKVIRNPITIEASFSPVATTSGPETLTIFPLNASTFFLVGANCTSFASP